jgi:hypothetical protein
MHSCLCPSHYQHNSPKPAQPAISFFSPTLLSFTPASHSSLITRHHFHFRFSASNSSNVRGQSSRNNLDKLRSASTLPPVWHRAQ